MEIYNLKNKNLEKVDTQNHVVTEEELSAITGGYAVVSDPIYSLTANESKILSQVGYKLKKTGSGNYRITDEKGNMASPSEISVLCNAINKCADKKSEGKTFWDWLLQD